MAVGQFLQNCPTHLARLSTKVLRTRLVEGARTLGSYLTKKNRILAPNMSFAKANLPARIAEIEMLIREEI